MEFVTERLTVRPIQLDDSCRLGELLTDETVGRTYMLPVFSSSGEVTDFCGRLAELSSRQDRYISAICLDDQLIGMVNDTEITAGTIEMGYAILPRFHNRGFGTEMLAGTIRYLLKQGFTEIVTGAFSENNASIRIMEKNGMQPMEKREKIEYRGRVHECIYYCYRKDM